MITHSHGKDHGHEHEGAGVAHTHLTSVGIDIGSSTSHLMFSQLLIGYPAFQRRRPEVLERRVIARSPILLTPFSGDWNIEAEPLRELIESTFREAGLKREDIDTGAVIVTGEAARRDNASKIAELFSGEAGRFVCATAGPKLETVLAAHGSGAVARSRDLGLKLLNVDVGGGTTKISVIDRGIIRQMTALNIGARLVACDDAGRIVRLETGGKRFLADLGLKLGLGDKLEPEVLTGLARRMAQVLFDILDGGHAPTEGVFVSDPIGDIPRVDEVVFSGGVSEYIYGREQAVFGDLGPVFGSEIKAQAETRGYRIVDSSEGIRATVIGASQYSTQVSGETIFIPETTSLPLHNLRVFPVRVSWEPPVAEIAEKAVRAALEGLDPEVKGTPFALYISSPPFLGYGVTQELARGIHAALMASSKTERPQLLAFGENVGRIVGGILAGDLNIPCVDEISLSELDFIDVGEMVEGEGFVPVVVKSLAFGV
ncbi:MAG: ethanolamine ammonia-lyase reactivating factor EutA [Candidatus Binatia bacterium]